VGMDEEQELKILGLLWLEYAIYEMKRENQ